MIYENGTSYEGGFKNNLKDGIGLFKFEDGSQYYGEWKDDHKSGRGTYTWTDGMKFEGSFLLGEKKEGVVTAKDGRTAQVKQ